MSISEQDKINYLALIVFIITALFSVGFYHPDEHFQILEFAQFKLGYIGSQDLAWEFNEKIRPSLHPWIVFIFLKFFYFIGINDPFFIATLFRLFSAIILWLIIVNLNKLFIDKYFQKTRWATIFRCSSFFLWFVPYTSVRFSSENYSAALFLVALLFIIKFRSKKKFILLAGACLGFSFLFRYQVGLLIFGMYAWLLFKDKIKISYLILSFIGLFSVLVFGIFLDYLFYGEFVITPFNYFNINLVAGKASEFGTDPFWFYISEFIISSVPPISIALLFFFIIGTWKLKNSIIVWSIIPFIVLHSIIPHKEMRFLFPIIYLFTLVSIYGLKEYFKERQIKSYHLKLFKFCVGINVVLLVGRILYPTSENVLLFRYLYKKNNGSAKIVLTTKYEYYNTNNLRTSFYRPKNIQSYFVESKSEIGGFLEKNNVASCYYIHRGYEFSDSIKGYRVKRVYSVYPEFISNLKFIDKNKLNTESIYLVSKNDK